MNASNELHRIELAPLPSRQSDGARNGSQGEYQAGAHSSTGRRGWGPGHPKFDGGLLASLWRTLEAPDNPKVSAAYQEKTGQSISRDAAGRYRPSDIPAARKGRPAGVGRKAVPRRFKMPAAGSVALAGPPIPAKAPGASPAASPAPSAVQDELAVMGSMAGLLGPLDSDARARVVAWLAARFANEGGQGS